jgi:hypothetical protein
MRHSNMLEEMPGILLAGCAGVRPVGDAWINAGHARINAGWA